MQKILHFSGPAVVGLLGSGGGNFGCSCLCLGLGIWSYDDWVFLGVDIWSCLCWVGVPFFGCLLSLRILGKCDNCGVPGRVLLQVDGWQLGTEMG